MFIIQQVVLLLRLITATSMLTSCILMTKWHLILIRFQIISEERLGIFQIFLAKKQLRVAV